jgi:hypothetical protein
MGVALTLVCFAVVLASNTAIFWSFEHRSFPSPWALGLGAVLAFLGAEACHHPLPFPEEDEEFAQELSPEFEAVEF